MRGLQQRAWPIARASRGKQVIGQRRNQDAENDGQRTPQLRRQDQCQQLSLVAELSQRDAGDRNQKGLHARG